ncbi:cytochrome P450 89A2-like [Triticum dicoccoides]|uniref:cytochrome P450 89A2-like n=1 Tax=Triticum dicoccoides TaxID=85692 RepID=UPI001891F039|nr:cytochrome P450 89A2-like [Triticum dicoccoides]
MQGLLLLVLPLVPLVVLAVIRHAGPIKTRLATVMSALAPKLPAAWRKPVFVSDCATAYRLLVRGSAGGSFSNRPPSMAPSAVLSAGRHHNITSAPHGPFWRAIRHNLTSQLFHPTRLHRYALARRNALRGLVADLREQQQQHGVVLAAESIRDAIFNVVCTMCFGDGVYPALVRAIADAQDDLVQSLPVVRVFVFSVFPVAVTRLIYRKQWNKLVSVRQKQEDMYLPLIDACRRRRRCSDEPPCYVDTLLDLEVPVKDDDHVASVGVGGSAQQQRISDAELVGLCSEFLGAGSETVAAAIQWIMANLVKRPDIQEAVRREIDDSVGAEAEEVLEKLEYLNAVVMEALRLHPTTALVFRQVMKEDDVVLDGRRIGVGTTMIFPLEALARDKTVWADPDVFKPERFLASGGGETMNLVAATGSAGKMKMMPFGAGRRICPGMGIAMLHIGYFVANLMREFVWKEAEGEHTIDLQPHTIVLVTVMKRPLRAHLLQRRRDAKNTS